MTVYSLFKKWMPQLDNTILCAALLSKNAKATAK